MPIALLATTPALAQEESGDAPAPVATETEAGGETREVYTPVDFARFAPRNALDMLNQVPGFSVVSADQGRGLGQANTNVLINGERVASKSESAFDVLRRIAAERVERIEIVDGASLGVPGLSGQVANVIARSGDISGRFEYRTVFRPRYARPSFVAGEVSLSGSGETLEWTLAATHNVGRGGAGGGQGTTITDGIGNVTERRDVLIRFMGEFPRVSGTLKWYGPGSLVANFNANYGRSYINSVNDEDRDVVTGVDLLREFDNRNRSFNYELGGDVEFDLGPGVLKLIGLERYNQGRSSADSLLIYDDGAPTTGSRFLNNSSGGEHIGRAEYRWDMLRGSWQMDAEAAFNRYSAVAQLFSRDAGGGYVQIPFPAGTGGVTEDRYEAILNHNRTLATGLSLQIGAGGEYSKLAQSGSGGQVRTFWRPKGSATLAWTPLTGLDISLKLARTVGQLSFGEFLGSVNLAQETGNAGNAELVPQQAWEADLEVKKNLAAWGSATLRFYGRQIEDYIDIIPVAGGLESRGNIDGTARLLGIGANATLNLDPIGWKGAKVDLSTAIENSRLTDPLTLVGRPFSSHDDFNGEISLRYDVPDTDWAMGAGFNWAHVQPYVRLFEVGREYEGPIYTFAFIEHKDVLGMTLNLNVFNLSGGQSRFERTAWEGLRDRTPIEFIERRHLDVSTIYRLQVIGSF